MGHFVFSLALLLTGFLSLGHELFICSLNTVESLARRHDYQVLRIPVISPSLSPLQLTSDPL